MGDLELGDCDGSGLLDGAFDGAFGGGAGVGLDLAPREPRRQHTCYDGRGGERRDAGEAVTHCSTPMNSTRTHRANRDDQPELTEGSTSPG